VKFVTFARHLALAATLCAGALLILPAPASATSCAKKKKKKKASAQAAPITSKTIKK